MRVWFVVRRMARIPVVVLGLLLAIVAAVSLQRGIPDDLRDRAQKRLLQGDSASQTEGLTLLRQALRQDPASPYRWCDLGEALVEAGETATAGYCFRRSLELGPNAPPIWMRAANFHFRLAETGEAVRCTARVLKIVPDYDAVVFSYWDRLIPETGDILSSIADDKRAAQSYFQHLISSGQTARAEIAWNWLAGRAFSDDRLAASYIDLLLARQQVQQAGEVWTAHLGARKGDYPDVNRLFNAGFEFPPTGAAFDWRISPVDAVEVTRDSGLAKAGRCSLRLRFLGKANVAYSHTAQTTPVSPGPYRLRAFVQTEALTTSEGIRFRIFDPQAPGRLDVRTAQLTGTHDWTALDQVVLVPVGTRLITVQICRDPSPKFDNKIQGTAWIDAVSLVPAR